MIRHLGMIALIFLMLSPGLFSEDLDQPSAFLVVLGPRVGGSYLFETPENFTARVREIYPTGTYFPAVTLFGITLEQRILLGQTKSHFAFQELVILGGLEQGIVLPEAAFLIGYRGYSGFEFGIGPIVNLSGFGVVAAVGWTFSYNGVYVPVDISFIIPNSNMPATIGLTTGFNFTVSKSEPADLD